MDQDELTIFSTILSPCILPDEDILIIATLPALINQCSIMDGLNDRGTPSIFPWGTVPVLLDHMESHLTVLLVVHLIKDDKEHVETGEERVGKVHVLCHTAVGQ